MEVILYNFKHFRLSIRLTPHMWGSVDKTSSVNPSSVHVGRAWLPFTTA